MDSVRTGDGSDDSIRFKPMERLKVYLFGVIVLFASFGMGEAVCRLLFLEFDGITDRIPVEVLFGLVFAWLATKFIYRNRKERSTRFKFIWARNHQIRGALEGITPLAHPSKNQQSIRVIREEVDRIEWVLSSGHPVRGGCVSLKLVQSALLSGRYFDPSSAELESAAQPGSAAKAVCSMERLCPLLSMAPALAIV